MTDDKNDKLIITGLELWLKVGCTAEERAFPQRIEMDLELEISLREAGEKDDLTKSIDYAAVVKTLTTALPRQTYRLAETVAERSAAMVLKRFRPQSVRIRLKKRALPGIAWAGVEIRRLKP